MTTQALSISTSDSSVSILDPNKTTSSEASGPLSPEAKKTEEVFQQEAAKRKSPTAQESHSKRAAPTKSEGSPTSPVSDEINLADQAAPLLGIALHEAQIKLQLQDFKEAIETIDTILKKPSISALLQRTTRPDVEELHFQLLKVKGLSFFEAEKDQMSLRNPATIDAALALLTPLQQKRDDFEILQALAYCFHRLSLCPSLSHMKDYHRLRADICYEKAHRHSPDDLSVVRDWMHFHVESEQYKKGLYLLNSVRSLLDTCDDVLILVPLLLDEARCYHCLSKPARYNSNDNPQKLCAYYRAKTQEILQKVEALVI